MNSHWPRLFDQTLRFAIHQTNRLRWRGSTGGILPEGYDPNSIASQAFLEFLQQPPSQPPSMVHQLKEVQYELNRLVLKQLTRLHHHKENLILRNAEDLARVWHMDGAWLTLWN